MARKMISLMLLCLSCNIRLSEGSAANQTNSTPTSPVVVSASPQPISPTTAPSQASTPPSSASRSSLAANSTVSSIEPSSTVVRASSSISGDTIQISAVGPSSRGNQPRYVVLPPQHQRRDYNLVANTRLRWVPYLLDKSGPEFSALKQHVEDHLNEVYEGLAGFLKSEVTEFTEEKVTFYAIIYTKSANQVSKAHLQDTLAATLLSENTELNIDAFQVTPRFTEIPNDGNVAVVSFPKKKEAEVVDGIMNFLQGFGAMSVLIVLFASIRFIKYKACNKKKPEDSDQEERLQGGYINEVTE